MFIKLMENLHSAPNQAKQAPPNPENKRTLHSPLLRRATIASASLVLSLGIGHNNSQAVDYVPDNQFPAAIDTAAIPERKAMPEEAPQTVIIKRRAPDVDKHKKHKRWIAELIPDSEAHNAPKGIFKVKPIKPSDVPPPPDSFTEITHNTSILPEAMRSYFKLNTAYNVLSDNICSALIVRNQAGEPIGEQTARHCLPKPQLDQAGNKTVFFNTAPLFYTGDALDLLQELPNQATSVAIPKNRTQDTALIAFNGHTTQEVGAALQAMTSDEIERLPIGTMLGNSGWPAIQTKNNGPKKRQEFPLYVIGVGVEDVQNEGKIRALITAVPESADGAICSPGDSGSPVISLDPSQRIRSVGNMSFFLSWSPAFEPDPEQAALNKEFYENKYNVKLDGFSAICGISFGSPDVTYPVISNQSGSEINEPPLPSPAEDATEQAKNDFENPNVPKTVLDGYLSIPAGKEVLIIHRPVLFYDTVQGSAVVGYNSNGQFIPVYFNKVELLNLMAKSDKSEIKVETVTGPLGSAGESSEDYGEFVSTDGTTFGEHMKLRPPELGAPFMIQPTKNGFDIVSVFSNWQK